jgi:hypothetical protein
MRDIFQSARRRPDVPGGGVSKVGLRNTHNSLQTDNVEALEGPASGNYSGPTCALFYDYSMVCCLPDGMSHGESVGTGTVMRTSTLNGYARSAGFDAATALAIEHDFFRFYGLQRAKQSPGECDRGAARRRQIKGATDSALVLQVGSTQPRAQYRFGRRRPGLVALLRHQTSLPWVSACVGGAAPRRAP